MNGNYFENPMKLSFGKGKHLSFHVSPIKYRQSSKKSLKTVKFGSKNLTSMKHDIKELFNEVLAFIKRLKPTNYKKMRGSCQGSCSLKPALNECPPCRVDAQ